MRLKIFTKLDLFQVTFFPSRADAWLKKHQLTAILEMHKHWKKIKPEFHIYFCLSLKDVIMEMETITIHAAAITYSDSFYTF